ncbi:hypothetical protein B0H63DRAFT_516519 [Podospora didyma]|uniref:Uncharacterized protein n=1 Tax=Podospora didyma TaxID=330526 RepID=A0AAE0P4S1_9PEZI|nr:hypothetical protein B0H63DRAFT_516519 [Podospora didyma]
MWTAFATCLFGIVFSATFIADFLHVAEPGNATVQQDTSWPPSAQHNNCPVIRCIGSESALRHSPFPDRTRIIILSATNNSFSDGSTTSSLYYTLGPFGHQADVAILSRNASYHKC